MEVELHNYLSSILKYAPEVIQWHLTTTSHVNNPRSWSMWTIAKTLCGLDNIISLLSTMVAQDESNYPPLIRSTLTYMTCTHQCAENFKTEAYKSKSEKLENRKIVYA